MTHTYLRTLKTLLTLCIYTSGYFESHVIYQSIYNEGEEGEEENRRGMQYTQFHD